MNVLKVDLRLIFISTTFQKYSDLWHFRIVEGKAGCCCNTPWPQLGMNSDALNVVIDAVWAPL